jgi:Ca2+-binding EF-hand superfamily protein
VRGRTGLKISYIRGSFLLFALVCAATEVSACLSTPEQRRAAFVKLDKDTDGFLTLGEYYSETVADIPPEKKQEHFTGVDTDHDGKLSFDEYSAQRQKQRCG